MTAKPRYVAALALIGLVFGLFWIGQSRIHIETDITAALPQGDPVVAAARRILEHHPALENLYIDLSLTGSGPPRPNLLTAAAEKVSEELKSEGLAEILTEKGATEFMPAFFQTVVHHLPVFFSREDLEIQVEPRLEPGNIEARLKEEYRQVFEMQGIGQARYLALDPLGLRNLVLARMAGMMPVKEADLYQGQIVTKDRNHLLMIAKPAGTSGDSRFSRRLKAALIRAERNVQNIASEDGRSVRLVYAGAFRAALDNEDIIRADTRQAIALVTIGVIVLVFLCFRRPAIGVLAVVPAVGGALLATFAYSLFQDVILAVALGFGGALISITVDHGLAYVLLLDQPRETRGHEVSREIWSVTSFTVLTTVVALLSLTLSGIPLFEEVGLFAALGVGLAALFVHLFFPLLFPSLGPARRRPWLPLDRILERLTSARGLVTVWGAVAFGLVMLCFAAPRFNADLTTMNTVRPETLEAEETIRRTWGDLGNRIYVLAEADRLETLPREMERLNRYLKDEQTKGQLTGAPLRSGILPGPEAQKENLAAWEAFWTGDRVEALRGALMPQAEKLGFAPDAFEPFFKILNFPDPGSLEFSEALLTPLGVLQNRQGGWLAIEAVEPGPKYQAETFFHRAAGTEFSVFDANYFTFHLARSLNTAFVQMLGLIGAAAAVLLLFLFLDFRLVALSLAPLVLAIVSTLGTLGLMGRPLSIPSLMLAPVVVGLGLDYGLYLVRSRQRFGRTDHPSSGAFRAAVLLGGLTTLIGMGSLILSQHQILENSGLTTFLGIGYSMVFTFALVPPLAERILAPRRLPDLIPATPGSPWHRKLARLRYQGLEPHPRMFALFKMKMDPMFPVLADYVGPSGTVIDLGCGYGVPAVWLSCLYPDLRFHSLDPDPERVRVAAQALRDRAEVRVGGALDLLDHGPDKAATALMLDMAHYLRDRDLDLILARLAHLLTPGGRLVIRATVPGGTRQVWMRGLERLRMKKAGLQPRFRSEAEMVRVLTRAGFAMETVTSTAPGREETWFIARREG